MMVNAPSINFFYEKAGFHFNNRTRLKKFLVKLFKKESTVLHSLNYIFCSDEYLLEINKKYLNHDYYTDIITFNLAKKGNAVGEVYISIDRVRENALLEGETLKRELHRVIFHGCLHLCGYTDKTHKEQSIMRNRENHYLKAYFE